jgi:perosamine synthetase
VTRPDNPRKEPARPLMTCWPGLIPAELWDYGTVDVLRGLRAVLSKASPAVGQILLPELGNCVTVRSARAGIVLAIRTLALAPKARVGVPLYCCPVVFKAIEAAGCEPRFIDVDPTTFCLSVDDVAKKRADIDVLIAVHMFGNVCDVPGLRDVIRNKPIIEDCAQSLGSRLRGQLAGGFGDISVFSFRSGKYLSVGEGGAVRAHDPTLRARLRRLAAEMTPASHTEECCHVLKSFVRSKLRSRPLYGLVGFPLWQVYNRSVSYSSKSPLIVGRIYRSDFALSVDRLVALDSVIEKRRAHAEFYARSLNRHSLTLCREATDAFYNRYQYPILLPSAAQRDRIAARLYAGHIEALRPYSDAADVAALHHGYTWDCPMSELIAQRVLVVPNHERMTDSDLRHVARVINAGIREFSSVDRPSRLGPGRARSSRRGMQGSTG